MKKASRWQRFKRWFGFGKASAFYRGAAPSRSRADWITHSSGPNTTLNAASRKVLVARHRDMVRNDAHIARVVSIYVHALVGTGLVGTARHDAKDPESKELAAQADALYRKVAKRGVLDALGLETAEGLQAQIVRAWLDGMVFVRRVWDKTAPVVPMRLQVLEADLLDESLTRSIDGGGIIRNGVEQNAAGRVVAYWMLPEHPGETVFGVSSRSERVPVEDIMQLKLPGRPGALTAAPLTAPVMVTKKNLGDFEDYTLIQKKSESLVVGVVTREPYSEWNPAPAQDGPFYDEDGKEIEPDVVVPGVVNADGELVGTMTPGQWLGVEAGTDVRFNQPQLSSNYDVFKRSHLQSVGAGTNISYEQLTGDFANANYSTMRGGMLEFWAEIDTLLWVYFVPLWDQVWQWIMEAAYLAGELPTADVEAEWQAPARPSIEPDKDAIAALIQVRAGWLDEDDVIKANGYQPDKLRERIKANNVKRDAAGIVSDADPRLYSWRGSAPVNAAPLTPDDAGGGQEAA